MIIDAHLHVWSQNINKYPWQPIGGYIPEQSASFEEYIQQMDAASIEKAVLVQPTPYGWDNSYLLDVCRGKKDRFKAVVLVDPSLKNSNDELARLIDVGVDGLRINLNLQPAENIKSDNFHKLIQTAENAGIPVCFQLTPEYFDQIHHIFDKYKKTQFILDHMAKPNKGSKLEDPVFKQFLSLAEYQNVFVKLSGFNYYSIESNPYQDTYPLLRAACDHYSAKRCMWGSDFPFVNDHWSIKGNLEAIQKEIGFSDLEISWILGKTANLVWWRK